MGSESEGLALVWECEIREDFEGREEKIFRAWMPTLTICVCLEGRLGQNRLEGRRTSGCEGREGVQGEADRWKVRRKTLNYGLQEQRREKIRDGNSTLETSRTAGVRAKEMPGAVRKQYEYALSVNRCWQGVALDNDENPLSFIRFCTLAVLWPSGYGVTFRSRPIRDGKPREFESRQCQLFFLCVYSLHPQTLKCVIPSVDKVSTERAPYFYHVP